MKTYYTNERNIQQIIFLLKAHGIKKVIVNPGSSNVSFVASIQNDPFFEMYSVVDERSAAYFACGLSAESGEPVVISCTGATSSRNYIPGLTEAYYRKLPIVVVTALMHSGYIGQNKPQVVDRRIPLNDIVRYSAQIDIVNSEDDEWANEVKINTALLELYHNGGGPVHLNMVTTFSSNFSVQKLPSSRVIYKLYKDSEFPALNEKKVAIFVGNHKKWSEKLVEAVDTFCEKYNAVVFGDHTSNYNGKYFILVNLISTQSQYHSESLDVDVLIDMGDVSGAYIDINAKEVWRVNPDGMIRDNRKRQKYVFEMEEIELFKKYNQLTLNAKNISNYLFATNEYKKIYEKINDNDLRFSNIWVAYATAGKLPQNSVIHFAILNSLRAWNFFKYDNSIMGYCNTGGFGIDGCTSSLIGASTVHTDKLYFLITGDLAFFYDINVIGNRHIGKNVRIILVNNGLGTEFKNYSCLASKFGNDTDIFISAAGHNGNKSKNLVKNLVTDLGFDYFSADSKDSYNKVLPNFLDATNNRPIVLEIFTDSKDESDALYMVNNIEISISDYTKNKFKQIAKEILGESGTQALKKRLKG